MGIARKNQSIQDWITQQWVILFGQRIDNKKHQWLLGPFGGTNGIGVKFVEQLARDESLVIDSNRKNRGLIDSIRNLGLPETELKKLSPNIINFYESTSDYDLLLKVKWNPLFKIFGIVVKSIFQTIDIES